MNQLTKAWLLLVGICAVSGCTGRRAVPVRGYTAKLINSSCVPGQPTRFRARVRIQRSDGQPITEPLPQVTFDATTLRSFPGIRYTTVASPHSAGRKFEEITIEGTVGRKVAGPTMLGLDLVEVQLTPLWKRLVSHGSLEPYHEVITRSPIGRITLPAPRPAGRSAQQD